MSASEFPGFPSQIRHYSSQSGGDGYVQQTANSEGKQGTLSFSGSGMNTYYDASPGQVPIQHRIVWKSKTEGQGDGTRSGTERSSENGDEYLQALRERVERLSRAGLSSEAQQLLNVSSGFGSFQSDWDEAGRQVEWARSQVEWAGRQVSVNLPPQPQQFQVPSQIQRSVQVEDESITSLTE